LRRAFTRRILSRPSGEHQAMSAPVEISERVSSALAYDRPVVALETTVLSHGLPWPSNLEAAQAMHRVVLEGGAVPAFVGVLDGRIRVGLDPAEIERFARAEGIVKASRRDLGIAAARGSSAGTTVAATMACAHLAGLQVFATGGIGGVHRGAGRSFDVSADLHELARTPVAVVCAGAKSILDLPATLEVLETLGVPVIGYDTDQMPAFHARSCGIALEHRADDAEAAASMLRAHWALGGAGIVVANPVPERDAIARETLEAWVGSALEQAERANITGKAVTPWLLTRVAQASEGRTLAANLALLEDNARVGAAIAAALAADAPTGNASDAARPGA